ncbi:hypothetical protein [Rhizobium sp. CF122]|uniref:hypothetical protein n=1 Tax=Rhizobium sp. CF122 TaxID=1144312 RepID=UPI003FD348B2
MGDGRNVCAISTPQQEPEALDRLGAIVRFLQKTAPFGQRGLPQAHDGGRNDNGEFGPLPVDPHGEIYTIYVARHVYRREDQVDVVPAIQDAQSFLAAGGIHGRQTGHFDRPPHRCSQFGAGLDNQNRGERFRLESYLGHGRYPCSDNELKHECCDAAIRMRKDLRRLNGIK